MCAMSEAAFSYRSLYLLCVRSQEMAMCLQATATLRGDQRRADTLNDEVMTLIAEGQRWYMRWERAGGYKLAPIKCLLPLRRTTLDDEGEFDLSNVIMFPTERNRANA